MSDPDLLGRAVWSVRKERELRGRRQAGLWAPLADHPLSPQPPGVPEQSGCLGSIHHTMYFTT